MSIVELRGWSEYLSMEPTNSVEIQLALLTSVVGNLMGGKTKIDDFLITSYRPPRDDTLQFASEEEVARALMAFATQ